MHFSNDKLALLADEYMGVYLVAYIKRCICNLSIYYLCARLASTSVNMGAISSTHIILIHHAQVYFHYLYRQAYWQINRK